MNGILNRTLQLWINSEIDANERLIWSGQPHAGSLAKRGVPLFVFGIPWTAFALFWTYAAAGFKFPDFKQGSDFFPLFGIPFILIGIGFLTAPLWTALFASRTAYVLTDKRALILKQSRSKVAIREFLPRDLTAVYREEHAGKGGSVIFHEAAPGQQGAIPNQAVGFIGIDNVREVEALVKTLAGKHKQSSS